MGPEAAASGLALTNKANKSCGPDRCAGDGTYLRASERHQSGLPMGGNEGAARSSDKYFITGLIGRAAASDRSIFATRRVPTAANGSQRVPDGAAACPQTRSRWIARNARRGQLADSVHARVNLRPAPPHPECVEHAPLPVRHLSRLARLEHINAGAAAPAALGARRR